MARWTGDADAKEESVGGQGGNFTPAPRGIYTIQVADFKDGTTATTKRPMVTLECEVADEGEYLGKKVWLTVTKIPKGEKGHGLFVHALHAFGLPHDGAYDFYTEDFQGRQARALLGVKPYTKVKDGRTYTNDVNFVETLYSKAHPEPGEIPPAQPAKASTEHPSLKQARGAEPAQVRGKAAVQEEVPF